MFEFKGKQYTLDQLQEVAQKKGYTFDELLSKNPDIKELGKTTPTSPGADVDETAAPELTVTESPSVDTSLESPKIESATVGPTTDLNPQKKDNEPSIFSGLSGGLAKIPFNITKQIQGLRDMILMPVASYAHPGLSIQERKNIIRNIPTMGMGMSIQSSQDITDKANKTLESIKEYQGKIENESLSKAWEAGNYRESAFLAADGLMQSLPSIGFSLMGPAGIATHGMLISGEKFAEEIEQSPDSELGALYMNAIATGALQAASDAAFRGLGQYAGIISKSGGASAAKDFLQTGFKEYAKKFLLIPGEGLTEVAQELGQVALDKISLGRDVDYDDLQYRLIDNFVIGSLMGGGAVTVSSLASSPKDKRAYAEGLLMPEDIKTKLNNKIDQYNNISQKIQTETNPLAKKGLEKGIFALENDISSLQAKYKTALYGMSDGQLKQYASNKDEVLKRKKELSKTTTDAGKESLIEEINELEKFNKEILKDAVTNTFEATNKATDAAFKAMGIDKQTLTADEIAKLNIEDASKIAETSDGFIYEDPETNQLKVVLNKNTIKRTKAVNAPAHELLHGLLVSTLKANPAAAINMKNALLETLKTMDADKVLNSDIKRRLLNYLNEPEAVEAEEVLTLFADATATGDIVFEENIFTKIGDRIRRFLQDLGIINIKFDTGQDVYNFIKDYNKSIKDGGVRAKIIEAAKKGFTGKLVKNTKDIKAEEDFKRFSKSEASKKVQQIYDEQGVAGAMDIIEAYKPLTTKLTNKYRDVPGFDFELLQSEIELGKRGLLDLIQAYTPDKGATLNTYVQGQLAKRAIEAANRILDTEFTLDVTEAKGVTDTTTEGVTERVEEDKPAERVSLRKQLGLDETIKPIVVNAVKKTFGTRLPEVTSKKFRPELERRFRTELKKPLAKLMGRTEDYRSFLSNNFEAVYEAIPQYVINRRFNAFAEAAVDANGKPLREKTAEGKKIFTKKKIVKAEWLKYFLGDDVGRSTQGTRKTALAEALAEQFAYDATMEVLADPKVVEKIKGISELTGQKFVDNYLDEVSEAIERPTTFKFSLSTKIESDWVTDPLNPLSGDKKYNFTVGKIPFESKVFNEPDFEYEIFEGTFGIEDGTLADDPKSVLLAFSEKETGSTEILGTATQGLTSAFQVFGTVANSTIDLVKKEKLNSVAFTAKEKSRIRLYNALAHKFAKELGWDYYAFPLNEGETGFIAYDPKILKEAEETNISKDVLKFSKSEIFDIEGNKVIIKDKLEDIFNISAKAANFNVTTSFNELEKEFLKYTNNNFKLADGTPYDAKVYRSILFEYYVGKLVEFYNPNIKLVNSFNGFSSAGIGDLTFESKETGEKIYAEIKMTGRAGIYPQMGGGGISVDLKKEEILEAEKGKKIPMFNYIKEALNKDGYSKTLIDILNKIGVKNIGKFTKEQVKEFDKIINKSKKEGKGNPLLKNINLGNTDNIVKGYAEQGVDIIISGNDVSNIVMHSLNNKNFGLDMPMLKGEGVATVRFTWASKSKGNATIRVINNIKGNTINKGASLQEVGQIKFSKSLNREFNQLLQATTGVEWFKTFSPAKARLAGKGKGRKFFIPYSADDFVGLLYATLGRDKVGDQQMAWYEENLLRPFSRGIQRYEAAKQKALRDWMMLKKQVKKDVPGGLNKANETGFTNQNSVRMYIWAKQGMEIPGAAKKDINDNVKIVNNDPVLKSFAERLIALNPEGYPKPGQSWDAGDITTDLVSYINDVRRAEFLTEWNENVKEIFNDTNKEKLRALYGNSYIEALEDMLHRMKTGRNRKFGASKIEKQFMDWTNNSVGAIMFFNARSAVLQTLSAVNFINFSDNNPINAGIAFVNQKQYWKDFSTLFNSDFLKQRRTGLQTDVNADEIANAAAGSTNKAKAVLSAILKLGFTPTQIADSFAIASGGATMYRNRIKKYLKEGLDQEAAEKRAFTDFQEIAEETQQSARPDRISMQQASSLGRLILAFGNTPMQYARLTKKAALDLVNGRGDWKTNISKIAYYSVIQNIIFSALQSGLFALLFDEEDEDKEKSRYYDIANKSFDTLLRGSGVYGAAASTVKNMILRIIEEGEKSRPDYRNVAITATEISPPINSKIKKLLSAGSTFTYKQSKEKVFTEGFSLENPAFLAAGKVISAGTNLPADRVVQKADHIYTAMQPETELWQAIALSLGWSEWDLGMIEKQTNKDLKGFKKLKTLKGLKKLK